MISTNKAKELINKEEYALLDVRTKEEYALDRIEPCKHIILNEEFENKIKKLDKNKKYLVLCRSGNRSRTACEILKQKGFEAYNIEGGILDW